MKVTSRCAVGTFSLGLFLVGSSLAHATWINPTGGDGANSSLQDVLNARIPAGYQPDASGAVNDAIGNDAYWAIDGGSAGQGAASIIIELAGYASQNSFGIYALGNDANRISVFSGTDSAGTTKSITIDAGGNVSINDVVKGNIGASGVFGFYFTTPQNRTYYSDTALNQVRNPGDTYSNGYGQTGADAAGQAVDHLVAFQGKDGGTVRVNGDKSWDANDYILAWEDLYGGGDRDYQDMVVLVHNISPVPDGGSTLVLLGGAILGVGILKRRAAKRI